MKPGRNPDDRVRAERPMPEVSEVRKRLRLAIERSKRDAAARRSQVEAAGREYERFLADVADPVFRAFLSALKGEGYPFELFTPAESLRLASERSANDYIEFVLDTSRDPAVVLGRISRTWGRRVLTAERPIREGVPIARLTEEDVLEFLLAEIGPFTAR